MADFAAFSKRFAAVSQRFTPRVTFKGLKVSKHLSEETTAFTATVLWDKVPLASARNDGRGGQTFLLALPGQQPRLAAVEAEVRKAFLAADLKHAGLDGVVDDAVAAAQEAAQVARWCKTQLVFGPTPDGKYIVVAASRLAAMFKTDPKAAAADLKTFLAHARNADLRSLPCVNLNRSRS